MNCKDINFYPGFWIDVVTYAFVALVIIIVCKWVWQEKELRRMKKLTEEYRLRMEEQAMEEAGVSPAEMAALQEDEETEAKADSSPAV